MLDIDVAVMTIEQSEDGRAAMKRVIAALASELATVELAAAKKLAERRGDVLIFPWHGDDRRMNAERRQQQQM